MPNPDLTMVTRGADATGSGATGACSTSPPGRPRDPEPLLDIDFLVRQTFGDTVLEAELRRLFDTQAALALARLATSPDAGEALKRADFVHSIKGAARAIGAVATATAAEDYEQALRADSPHVDAALGRFVAALTAVRIALAARADVTDEPGAGPSAPNERR
jgi:HPt (histidine-containing phosphotransfer) domain-containing protein